MVSKPDKQYHLIGICGIGMSAIAHLLVRRGARVTGSDLKETAISKKLKEQGVRVFTGHNPANIQGADLIIYSSAIKGDNPEIEEARRQGIPLMKRAEALAQLMKGEVAITVAGSHGKTTTASLASYLLLQAGLAPTIAVGGIIRNIDTNAYLGEGKFFVAEADESDGSFLYYRPKYSIVTNIDYEHLDFYKEIRREIDAFREFLRNTDKDGCVFACSDDAHLKDIVRGHKGRRILFGLQDGADIYPEDIRIEGLSSRFECFYNNKFIDTFCVALGGRHNISNALSIIALGLELGIDLQVIKNTLLTYKGAQRRQEIKFNDQRYLVIDDYAHHPTEIKATLAALKNLRSDRVIAVFQPHRYTRTSILLGEFGRSFDLADCIIVTDIYSAGEPPLKGVTGELLCDEIKKHNPRKEVKFMPRGEIANSILGIIRPGDMIVTLGAGDIVKTGEELAGKLKIRP